MSEWVVFKGEDGGGEPPGGFWAGGGGRFVDSGMSGVLDSEDYLFIYLFIYLLWMNE